ncbi:Palmitoyltransferase [Rhodotorula sphaerocarpa]
MGKRLDQLWVVSVVLLISFIGFTSQIWVVFPAGRYRFSDPELLRVLLPFNALLAGVFGNYALTVRTDPGRVPKGWRPDPKLFRLSQDEVKTQTGGARFCRSCHGPWVNNCVGHHNYGHFVRFLIFVDLACTYHLWMITTQALTAIDKFVEPTKTQIVMLVLNYAACIPVILAVGIFSLFHLWAVLTNTSTIESWEKDRAHSLKRRGKIPEYTYPYHIGYVRNIQAVLGTNPILWLWPQKTPGDGLIFPVATGTSLAQQLEWPPRDEFAPRKRPVHPPGLDVAAFTYGEGLNPALRRGRLPGGDFVEVARESGLDGAGLNHLRQRRSRPRAAPQPVSVRTASGSETSYDSTTTPGSSSSNEEEYADDDDDDVPLGQLAARRARAAAAQVSIGACVEDVAFDEAVEADSAGEADEEDLAPERGVRIRRGSEGYEIRPRRPWNEAEGQASDVEEEWQQVSAEEAL